MTLHDPALFTEHMESTPPAERELPQCLWETRSKLTRCRNTLQQTAVSLFCAAATLAGPNRIQRPGHRPEIKGDQKS